MHTEERNPGTGPATDAAGETPVGTPFAIHQGPVAAAAATLRVRSWQEAAWWATALMVVTAEVLLLWAGPANAQGQEIDTCAAGNSIGGEGGAQILGAIRNGALFAAAGVGSLTVLGIIISGAMLAAGSVSKDWVKRGTTGITFSGIGGGVAVLAAALWGVLYWATCQG